MKRFANILCANVFRNTRSQHATDVREYNETTWKLILALSDNFLQVNYLKSADD